MISEKLSAATSSNSSVLGDGWRQDHQAFRATLGYSRPGFWERKGRGKKRRGGKEKKGRESFQWYQHTDAGGLPSSGSAPSNGGPCTRQSRHLTTPSRPLPPAQVVHACTHVVHQYPPCRTCLKSKAKSFLVIGTTNFLEPLGPHNLSAVWHTGTLTQIVHGNPLYSLLCLLQGIVSLSTPGSGEPGAYTGLCCTSCTRAHTSSLFGPLHRCARPSCTLTCAAPARVGLGSGKRMLHLNEGLWVVLQLWSQEYQTSCGTKLDSRRAAVARWPWHPALESRPARTGLGCLLLVGQGGGDRLLNRQRCTTGCRGRL